MTSEMTSNESLIRLKFKAIFNYIIRGIDGNQSAFFFLIRGKTFKVELEKERERESKLTPQYCSIFFNALWIYKFSV